MSNQKPSLPPKITLQEMKRRLSSAQEVGVDEAGTVETLVDRMARSDEIVVDSDGRIHAPDEPGVASTPLPNKTVVKPSRWF